jgi:Putative lumazine-binding
VPFRAITLTTVLVLLASACGRSPERDVRDTLNAFAEATAKKDYQRLCDDIFSEKLVEQVRQQVPCELALKNSSLGDAQKPKLEIKRITVDGDVANAVVASSAANQRPSEDTVRLVKEGEDWRIQALSS